MNSYAQKKHKSFIGLVCLLILVITACGQTPSNNISVNDGTMVELNLSFDEALGLSTQALPFENGTTAVSRFEVQVRDANNALVRFDSENTIDATGTVETLVIVPGESLPISISTGTYTFTSSAYAPDKAGGAEVILAIGTNEVTITLDTTAVPLNVKTITVGYSFESNVPLNYIVPGQTLDLMLEVRAPGGYSVPLADYGVTYTIDPDNVESHLESIRGVRLTVKDPLVDSDLSVLANVTGTSASGSALSLPEVDGVLNIGFLTSGVGPGFDIQPPSFSFVEPPALKAEEAFSITGTASDDIGIDKVQIFDGPELIASSSSTEFAAENVGQINFNGNNWSMSFIPKQGSYSLFAVALDTSGNQTSTSYEVTAGAECVVSNSNDSGAGSLRQCILDANDGDFITFGQFGYREVMLTSGQIVLNKDLTITGSYDTRIVGFLSNNREQPNFSLNGGVTVIMNNITLMHFDSFNTKGTIHVESGSHLILSGNTEISRNHSEIGVIYNDGGIVTLKDNATISDNQGMFAGGIFNSGTVNIQDNATIVGNDAGFHEEGAGGIYNTPSGIIVGAIYDGSADQNVFGNSPNQVLEGNDNHWFF